jgi:anti-sigma-K factor RskA
MSAGNPMEDEDKILAAEYVAGLLTPAERAAFERRLGQEPNLRADVRFWDEKLLPMTDEIAPVQAPQRIYTAIENRLFTEEAKAGSWLESLFFWRSLSFASIAALAVAGILFVETPRPSNVATENFVAELSGPQQAVKLVVLYDSKNNEIKFNRVSGQAVSGRDFELWLIEGKNPPVSLGVLPTSANGIIKISDSLKQKIAGSVLAISDEPTGGSPTGQPTGAVLATGNMNLI